MRLTPGKFVRKHWRGLLVFFSPIIIVTVCLNWPETEERPAVRLVDEEPVDSILLHSRYVDSVMSLPRKDVPLAARRRPATGYRFRRSGEYNRGFPDMNDLQLRTAQRLGISIIADREEAVKRLDELVYVGENPFYVIEDLDYSIPYLVPRAARLLEEISRSFIDSLASRGLPFYKLLVTSVLRTEKDVKKLRRVNVNATENSCHQHGTTFDITYNKYLPVYDPEKAPQRDVWPAELKQILAEVLDDLRRRGLCYVRYEYRQSCFHITAR